MTVTRLVATCFVVGLATTAHAQLPRVGVEAAGSAPTPDPRATAVLGSVPSGDTTERILRLTLEDAIGRALRNNLGLLNGLNEIDEAASAHRRAKSQLLPHLTSRTAWSSQQINLAAFGFTGFPDLPSVVGPFPLFDTRLHLSQSLFDLDALNHARAESMEVTVAGLRLEETRRLVVLTASNLYLRGGAAAARIAAVQVQHDTAQTLYDLAADLKAGGLVAGIDVLRAELQRDSARQRVIVAERDFERAKLTLARMIGLPLGQSFVLTDAAPDISTADISLEEALTEAYAGRPDYRAAVTRVEAAESHRRAATSERLPSVDLAADVGRLGQGPVQNAHSTYTVAGSVRIPIFQGGRVGARVLEADAQLRRRRDELAAFRGQVDYEVRVALLDVRAAAEQVQLSTRSVAIASQELVQARNRFAAGVASNIEVVEAQESVATATDTHISARYAHNVAKISLAHAIGATESRITESLGVQPK